MKTDASELLRDVHLHGALGEAFGRLHRIAVASPAEAVRALSFLCRGFRKAIAEGTWRIIRGEPETGLCLGESELGFRLGRAPLHIVPVAAGAGGRGIGKIVGGLALAAGAFFLGPGVAGLAGLGVIGGTVATAGIGIGLSLALQGTSALLSSNPIAANGRGGVTARASFAFSGPENVTAQGGCVPLVFGRFRVGSVVISAGLQAEQIPA